MFQLGKILLLSLVSGFGTAAIAANAVSNTLATFMTRPGMAIGFAIITVVSRCIGAGDYKQARYYTRKLIKITYLALLLTNALIILGLPAVLSLYHLSDITASMTTQIIFSYAAATIVIWAPAFSLPNTLRAANDVKFSMVVSILSMWIFRIGFSFLLAKNMGLGVFGVWISMYIDWLVRSILFVLRYKGVSWYRYTGC